MRRSDGRGRGPNVVSPCHTYSAMAVQYSASGGSSASCELLLHRDLKSSWTLSVSLRWAYLRRRLWQYQQHPAIEAALTIATETQTPRTRARWGVSADGLGRGEASWLAKTPHSGLCVLV